MNRPSVGLAVVSTAGPSSSAGCRALNVTKQPADSTCRRPAPDNPAGNLNTHFATVTKPSQVRELYLHVETRFAPRIAVRIPVLGRSTPKSLATVPKFSSCAQGRGM